jgi:predicted MFS family arabinose efflux permease
LIESAAINIGFWRAVWLASFSSMAAMRVCDSMLPALVDQWLSSTVIASYTIASFGLAYGLLQLLYGTLSDRVGKLRVMAWVCLGAVAANLACALAPSIEALIVFRACAGAFSAGVVPVALAYVGDSAAPGQRQQTLGKFVSATISGIICGQVLGAIAADSIGWRWAFGFMAALFAASAWSLRAQFFLRKNPSDAHRQLSPWAALKRPEVRLFLPLALIQGAVSFAPLSLVPSLLVQRMNISLTIASSVVICFALGGLIYGRLVSWLLHRFSREQLAVLGSCLMAIGLISIAIGPPLPILWGFGLVGGLGSTMLHNTLQTQATALIPGASGTAVSMFALMLFFGQAFTVPSIAWALPQWGGSLVYICIALALLVHGQLVARHIRTHHSVE